jgi:mRNA interferase RelE/StbE
MVFEDIPNYESLNQIAHLKKIKGANNTYRIRLGDYRIGILLDQDTIIFERVLHRKDIYRNFP